MEAMRVSSKEYPLLCSLAEVCGGETITDELLLLMGNPKYKAKDWLSKPKESCEVFSLYAAAHHLIPVEMVVTDPHKIKENFFQTVWKNHIKSIKDQTILVNMTLVPRLHESIIDIKQKLAAAKQNAFFLTIVLREMLLAWMGKQSISENLETFHVWAGSIYEEVDGKYVRIAQQVIREYFGYVSLLYLFLMKLTLTTKLPFLVLMLKEEQEIAKHANSFNVLLETVQQLTNKANKHTLCGLKELMSFNEKIPTRKKSYCEKQTDLFGEHLSSHNNINEDIDKTLTEITLFIENAQKISVQKRTKL